MQTSQPQTAFWPVSDGVVRHRWLWHAELEHDFSSDAVYEVLEEDAVYKLLCRSKWKDIRKDNYHWRIECRWLLSWGWIIKFYWVKHSEKEANLTALEENLTPKSFSFKVAVKRCLWPARVLRRRLWSGWGDPVAHGVLPMCYRVTSLICFVGTEDSHCFD